MCLCYIHVAGFYFSCCFGFFNGGTKESRGDDARAVMVDGCKCRATGGEEGGGQGRGGEAEAAPNHYCLVTV